MIKKYLLDLYIYHLENIFASNNKDKKEYTWNKIKNHKTLLKYASKLENKSFKSNIIVSKILKEKDLYNTDIYNNIINIIYTNTDIANKKINNSATTFLMLTLHNENLSLTKEQKLLLILTGENSPFTAKYYKYNLDSEKNMHGSGLNDLRFKILCNASFKDQEKINLINMFYPDDEIKIAILKELEWNIIIELKIKNYNEFYDEIYELDTTNLPQNIVSKINLCKYIKTILPEKIIKGYFNNE